MNCVGTAMLPPLFVIVTKFYLKFFVMSVQVATFTLSNQTYKDNANSFVYIRYPFFLLS